MHALGACAHARPHDGQPRRGQRWLCRHRARCAPSSPIWPLPRVPFRAASSASCCGTSPTTRAESCAGASARPASILDEPGRRRVQTQRRYHRARPGRLLRRRDRDRPRDAEGHRRRFAPERLRSCARCSPATFSRAWRSTAARSSTAGSSPQRRRFRGCHVGRCWSIWPEARPGDEVFGYLEKWLELAPFDQRVHELLLDAFGRGGRIREGEEHLAATTRLSRRRGSTARRFAMRGGLPGRRQARADVRAASLPPDGLSPAPLPRQPIEIAGGPAAPPIAVMPFVDRTAAGGAPAAAPPTGSPTTSSPARQAAQPVRHRAGHRLRAARARASVRKKPAAC